jgi:hypothetical protein
MARITVTDYECEHDLLPPLCAKCGAPTAERAPRTVRMLDDKRIWVAVVFLFGLFFFPPLVVLVILRIARANQVRVPICPDHRNHWAWRDWAMSWVLIPGWAAVVLAAEAYGAFLQMEGRDGSAFFCVGLPALAVALVLENWAIGYGAVKVEQAHKDKVKLVGVHETFVAALLEERARDRVANPDRRALRGDMRDDFDDEPV